MSAFFAHTSRRQFLRASGVTFALPALHSLNPRQLFAAEPESPRRMVLINASMGLLPKEFFPKGTGREYQSSAYLNHFEELREKFTVFSGLSHPEVSGGHHAESCFLTAAPRIGTSGFQQTISVDQFAAERIGIQTRVPSLVLHAGAEGHKNGLSWTSSGVSLPAEDKPSRLYRQLFLSGNRPEVDAKIDELQVGRSILDSVADRAKSLEGRLGLSDRAKLDEYYTSVRELERRLQTAQEWERKPKPKVDAETPEDVTDRADIVSQARLMYDMIRLALQTDSTRIVSLKVHSYSSVSIPGVTQGHHSLTHHGNRPDALTQLKLIEEARLLEFRDFLASLQSTPDGGHSLLDRTMVLYGSHLGDANRHTNSNLPILLAGGGFKHGQHLAFDAQHNTPLPNLFVSMLQHLGIETDSFASSTGTLTGLEAA